MKLNGVRLELGEVEGVLSRCELLVRHAAALVIDGALVAAVETTDAALATSAMAREAAAALLTTHCHRWLPSAVCPSAIAVLESIPLTQDLELRLVFKLL